MNQPSIRRICGASAGATCIVLAGLLAGCAKEDQPPQAASPPPEQSPVAAVPAEEVSQPAAVETPPAQTPAVESPAKEAVAQPEPPTSASTAETATVGSCDGENTATVPKAATGQALADALMDQWLRDHPEEDWVAEEKAKHNPKPPADNADVLEGGQGKGHAYGNYTQIDVLTWARETEKAVAEGSRIFHSGDELGSTVAVSCDMCHPHAANTHPETYPKYQVQLGRVVLLRDMINWCIENPVRGTKLDADSPTMRALEAYILAQRKGTPMNYGKH